MDILLINDDAIFHNGPLTKSQTTQPFVGTVKQRLLIRLRTFYGEWFINTTYGVPYWQRILGIKNKKEAVDLIFQQQILAESGVKEISSFSSSFSGRNYSMKFTAKVITGETVTVSFTTTV